MDLVKWEDITSSDRWKELSLKDREKLRAAFFNDTLRYGAQTNPTIRNWIERGDVENLKKMKDYFYEKTNPQMYSNLFEEAAAKTIAALGRGAAEGIHTLERVHKGAASLMELAPAAQPLGQLIEAGITGEPLEEIEKEEAPVVNAEDVHRATQTVQQAIEGASQKAQKFILEKTGAALPATQPETLPGKLLLGGVEFLPQMPLFEVFGGRAAMDLVERGISRLLLAKYPADAVAKLGEKFLFKTAMRGAGAAAGAVPWSAVSGEPLWESMKGFALASMGLGALGDAFHALKVKVKGEGLSKPAREHLNTAGVGSNNIDEALEKASKISEAEGEPGAADEIRTKAPEIKKAYEEGLLIGAKPAEAGAEILGPHGMPAHYEVAQKKIQEALETPGWMRTAEQKALIEHYDKALDKWAEYEYNKTLSPEEQSIIADIERRVAKEEPDLAEELGIKPEEVKTEEVEAKPLEEEPESWDVGDITKGKTVVYRGYSSASPGDRTYWTPSREFAETTALARVKAKGGKPILEIAKLNIKNPYITEFLPFEVDTADLDPSMDAVITKSGREILLLNPEEQITPLEKTEKIMKPEVKPVEAKPVEAEVEPPEAGKPAEPISYRSLKKGDYVRWEYEDKTGEGRIIGDKPFSRGGFVGRYVETPEGKRVAMPWGSRVKYWREPIVEEAEAAPKAEVKAEAPEVKPEEATEPQVLLRGTTKEKAERLAKKKGAQVEPDELNPGMYKVVKPVKLYAGIPVDIDAISRSEIGKIGKGLKDITVELLSPARASGKKELIIRIYRTAKGKWSLYNNRLFGFYRPIERLLDRLPDDDAFEIAMRLEEKDLTHQDLDELAPKFTPEQKAKVLEWSKGRRAIMDSLWTFLNQAGLIENYAFKYLMHEYEFPEEIARKYAGRFAAITKERKFPTYREAFRWFREEAKKYYRLTAEEEKYLSEIKPRFTNPARIDLAYIRHATELLAFDQAIKSGLDAGVIKRVEDIRDIPAGFEGINDNRLVRSLPTTRGDAFAGRLYADRAMKKVLDNWASTGLWRGRGTASDIYRGIRQINNHMNAFNLSFLNFFHLTFTLHSLMAEQAGAMIRDVLNLKWGRALKRTYKVLPVTSWIWAKEQVKLGHDLMKLAYGERKPVTEFDHRFLKWLEYGNYNPKLDPYYRVRYFTEFVDKWQKDPRSAMTPVGLTRAIIDGTSWPLMEFGIPRLKLAEFARLMGENIERLQPVTEAEEADIAIKVADHIDNVFGQMQYDNLAWNRIWKDLLFITLRSVGWNWGDIRVSFHAGEDAIKAARALMQADFKTARRYGLNDDLMFVVGLPTVIALNGAIYMMARGIKPEDWKDYFFWPTGDINPDGTRERISPASYLKDVLAAFYKSPLRIFRDKMAPLLSSVIYLLKNVDYYNRQIVDTARVEPQFQKLLHQATQAIEFLGAQWAPFSFRGYTMRRRAGAGVLEAITAGAGYPPAPSYLGRTKAQKKIYELSGYHHGVMPKYVQEQVDLKQKMRLAWQKDKRIPHELVKTYVNKYGASSYRSFYRNLRRNIPPDVALYKSLRNVDEKIRVLQACKDKDEFMKFWKVTSPTARAWYRKAYREATYKGGMIKPPSAKKIEITERAIPIR